MIKGSRRVKDLIKNIAQGDSGRAQRLQRHYALERFLERVSLSRYRDNLILKGGMLVAAIVGLESRATMDMDATCKGYPIDVESATEMVHEIAAIDIGDGMAFEIIDVSEIMEDSEYGGVRVALISYSDKMKTNIKIDISTGDAITPSEIRFSYKLMLEDRSLDILTYSIETVLAEKLQTILSRSVYNSRARDYYDIHALIEADRIPEPSNLAKAFERTCIQRESLHLLERSDGILQEIEQSVPMREQWDRYRKAFDYAEDISWEDAFAAVRKLIDLIAI